MIRFTARELARYFGLSVSTVRSWKKRGLIHPVGERGGALEFDFFEAVEVEHRNRHSPNLRVPRPRAIVTH